MNDLALYIQDLIRTHGPITLERYMDLALSHPEFGYYMKSDPLGAQGDFTTAPEITQMFGELLGLWAVEVWTMMNKPTPVRLVELGPGRGTLMSDALRAARVAPDFRAAIDVVLVETDPVLAEVQHETLLTADAPISWALTLDEVADGPAIILANEFLDALPIRQYVYTNRHWHERLVGLDAAGQFCFLTDTGAELSIHGQAEEGDIIEASPAAHALMYKLAGRLVKQDGAALFLDYGHTMSSVGDTLQAVSRHKYVSPFQDPGTCDLTAHVDFAAMMRSARAAGATVHGPLDQGDFLREIGIDQRTRALGNRMPNRVTDFETARDRLVSKGREGMGGLFKVLAIANRTLSTPPGFELVL